MSTPNPYTLFQKSIVLIDQNAVALVGEDANGDIATKFQLDGESLSPIG